MRALILDERAQAKIDRVKAFAAQPENFYHVGADGFSLQRPPGDDERHVVYLERGFRVVFSITGADGKLWRHLSISVTGPKYPRPYAAFMIAQAFGFTGWDDKTEVPAPDWQMQIHEKDHCVVMAQPLT